jgi:sec-independent protein translocase protein TatA
MDIGAPELIVVLVILLLIMGPGKLAGLGGSLGKSIREFRSALQGDEQKPAPAGVERATETAMVSPAKVPQITAASDGETTAGTVKQ